MDNHNHSHNHSDHHAHMIRDFRRRFWVSLVLTVSILVLAPLIQEWLGIQETLAFTGDSYVLFVLSSVVFFYGGWPFLNGLYDELKKKQPGMMTLIGVAITVAYVYSTAVVFGLSGKTFFWELATLIVVMLLGHWIEMRSVMGASKALEELAKLLPNTAHKLQGDGSTKDVPIEELNKDDKVIIKPGEKIPADGIITEGSTSVNEAMITGESKPVAKEKENEVIGGSVNQDGSITVQVKKTGKDSYLSQVVEMVKSAQAGKSQTQNLANRAAFWLTIVALGSGIITWLVWYLVVGREFVFALERTVTVMVIACPHALGLAIPLVVAVSTSLSAKNGLLIRNRSQFEQARDIQAVMFDKTGTLTKGTFEVTDIITFTDIDRDDLLSLASAVESRSEHTIARAIAQAGDLDKQVSDFQAIPGKGVQGTVGDKEIKIVSPGYLEENDISIDSNDADDALQQGKTVVYVLIDDKPQGAIALADAVREESKQAVKKLNDLGLKVMMITGDNKQVAENVAGELGIDEYFAEVLPDKKADKVKEVQSRGITVAMVGDGVNDAPALAQADVGIAIGAGTDVAAETADVVLVKNNPLDVLKLVRYAKATYRKMIQNLIWATGYNVIAIPLAAGVLAGIGIILNPAIGALLMSASTVVVAVNARLLKV